MLRGQADDEEIRGLANAIIDDPSLYLWFAWRTDDLGPVDLGLEAEEMAQLVQLTELCHTLLFARPIEWTRTEMGQRSTFAFAFMACPIDPAVAQMKGRMPG